MRKLPKELGVEGIGDVEGKVRRKTQAVYGTRREVADVLRRVLAGRICATATAAQPHTSYQYRPVGKTVPVSVEPDYVRGKVYEVSVDVRGIGEIPEIRKGVFGYERPLLLTEGNGSAVPGKLVAEPHNLIRGEVVPPQGSYPEGVEHAVVRTDEDHTEVPVVEYRRSGVDYVPQLPSVTEVVSPPVPATLYMLSPYEVYKVVHRISRSGKTRGEVGCVPEEGLKEESVCCCKLNECVVLAHRVYPPVRRACVLQDLTRFPYGMDLVEGVVGGNEVVVVVVCVYPEVPGLIHPEVEFEVLIEVEYLVLVRVLPYALLVRREVEPVVV